MSSGTTAVPLYQVDAFTTRPFEGNPAAICLVKEDLPVEQMKAIAAEMNLSETAFVKPLNHGDHDQEHNQHHYSLRWFTPQVEVPLCGHATLATAHTLFSRLPAAVTLLTFHTLSGELIAQRNSPHDGFYSIFLPTADTIPFSQANV